MPRKDKLAYASYMRGYMRAYRSKLRPSEYLYVNPPIRRDVNPIVRKVLYIVNTITGEVMGSATPQLIRRLNTIGTINADGTIPGSIFALGPNSLYTVKPEASEKGLDSRVKVLESRVIQIEAGQVLREVQESYA